MKFTLCRGAGVDCFFCSTFNRFFMEKVPFYECVARCSAGGKLVMSDSMVNAAIRWRSEYIHGLSGAERYRELLSLGDFCIEQRRDREAMDAYVDVLDYVLRDGSVAKRNRERFYRQAADGIMYLSGSADEVVWEICSQMCDRWR